MTGNPLILFALGYATAFGLGILAAIALYRWANK